MSELKQPTVSVVMITYGHEAFIRQAVEGVLMQDCDFPVELIVADDCSPDNTAGVMQEIMATHPRASWIRYIRHTQNKGMMPNFIWALGQANGKYIALCEGDDYWTDPCKLQRQVDFLEGNQEYVMCYTAVEQRNLINGQRQNLGDKKERVFELTDFMKENYAFTLTVVFRNIFNFPVYQNHLLKVPFGDWMLYNIILKKGQAFYTPDLTGIYQVHGKNSDFHDPRSYKKKLREMNFAFLKLHGYMYSFIFIKRFFELGVKLIY